MKERKSVGIWIRVSTEDQAKGESPEHHEKRARLYAEAKGWDVVDVYHLEALSGKSVMGYAETKRMLEDIQKEKITGLIFSKLARLARNTKELLEFADIFKAANADLISLQEAIDTSTPAGRLFYTMIAAMAQWEREEIADRVAASVVIRAKMGKNIGGHASLGYKWDGHTLVIDEDRAPIRRSVFELFLKHRRLKRVATILNEQGHRTTRGKKFTLQSVEVLLRDTAVIGQRRANYKKNIDGKTIVKDPSEWIIVPCPELVSRDMWEECNRILDESKKPQKQRGPKPKHLLAGYLHCSCDKKMYVFHEGRSQTYRCKRCKNRIAEEDIHEIYKEQLRSFLLTDIDEKSYIDKVSAELLEKEQQLDSLLRKQNDVKKEIDGLVRMRARNEMNKEIFTQQYKPLEEQFMQLTAHLPELQSAIDIMKIQQQSSHVVLSDARDLYSKWDDLEFDDKRHIVELITDKIVVGQEDIHIQLSYLPTLNRPPHTPDSQNDGKSITTLRATCNPAVQIRNLRVN